MEFYNFKFLTIILLSMICCIVAVTAEHNSTVWLTVVFAMVVLAIINHEGDKL